MHVLVCGGRDYDDWRRVNATLDMLDASHGVTCVIQGGAKGADALARAWARHHDVELLNFPADWNMESDEACEKKIVQRDDGTWYNALAGFNRNNKMLLEGCPDIVVAFAGGNGTEHMSSIAEGMKIPVLEVPATGKVRWRSPPDPTRPKIIRRGKQTPPGRYEGEF